MNRNTLVLAVVGLLSALPLVISCNKVETPKPTYNHDMSSYKKLAADALRLVKDNKQAEAYPKTKELEKAFDKGTEDMKAADPKLWTEIDTQMDVAIDATNPAKGGDPQAAMVELQKFLDLLDKVK